MKRTAILFGLFILLASTAAGASTPAPVAIGVDIGTTAAGAFMGAVSLGFSLELPLSRAWALDLEPSFYAASGTDMTIVQINAAALARFYLVSLFVNEAAPAQWGPFLSAGATAAWGLLDEAQAIATVSLGPTVRAGYRLVFGDVGLFLETSVGYMALFGVQVTPAGASFSANGGLTLGLVAGWRF